MRVLPCLSRGLWANGLTSLVPVCEMGLQGAKVKHRSLGKVGPIKGITVQFLLPGNSQLRTRQPERQVELLGPEFRCCCEGENGGRAAPGREGWLLGGGEQVAICSRQ